MDQIAFGHFCGDHPVVRSNKKKFLLLYSKIENLTDGMFQFGHISPFTAQWLLYVTPGLTLKKF
jgi:hypothetical protein